MVLKDHDLRQLDEARIRDLKEKDPEALVSLSVRLLEDLKEARERLNQNPSNSSRPPSSQAPWFRAQEDEEDTEDPSDDEDREAPPEEATADPRADTQPGPSGQDSTDNGDSSDTTVRRKPGRQPGAPGFGRTQKLTITDWEAHRPSTCALCARALDPDPTTAYTAFDTVDLVFGNTSLPGKFHLLELPPAFGAIVGLDYLRARRVESCIPKFFRIRCTQFLGVELRAESCYMLAG